jgi:quinol monooxygenase YgiN
MYGLIGKMKAVAGKRDALTFILLAGLRDMPGNLSYIVANDPADEDMIWITEVWTDQAAHQASLSLPSVQAAITAGRPLIAGMESIATTVPIGGEGLKAG